MFEHGKGCSDIAYFTLYFYVFFHGVGMVFNEIYCQKIKIYVNLD